MVTNSALLFAGLGMGLLGSPHCLGMCGGIVSAFGLSMQKLSPAKKTALMLSYHAGRLASYAMLGVLASVVGSAVLAPFAHSAAPRVVLGMALVLAALMMLGLPILTRLEWVGSWVWHSMASIRKKVFPLTTLPKALAAGVLWGLLPCGLVYGALLVAATGAGANHASFGVIFMLLFGLGTIPMLVATQGVIMALQTYVQRFSLRRFSGAIMLLSGVLVAASPLLHNHDHSHMHGGMHSDHGDHNHHDHSHHHH